MTIYAYYIAAAIVLAWIAIAINGDTLRENVSVGCGIAAAAMFLYGLVMSVAVSL